MQFSTIAQLIRVVAHYIAAMTLGDAVADQEIVQGAIGGLVSIGALAWWIFFERDRLDTGGIR